MEAMRISDLARETGFAPSTVRYYEREGLLPQPRRSEGGQRLYDEEAVARLRFVDRAKRLGLSLQDVRTLLGSWSEGSCRDTRDRLRAVLRVRREHVRQQQEALAALERRLAEACAALEAEAAADACFEACGCPPDVPGDAVAPEAPPALERGGSGA